MEQFFTSILAFIVAIGLLVAFHEFGHFWVARKLGVKVLRFSIGFGKPLWTKVYGADKTEFVLAAIPLGGYVKMLDEREGEVAQHELHRAFTQQSVGKRVAIVAAGPVFNFIFAIFAYFMMYLIGIPGIKPIVGDVVENSVAAKAGLQIQEEIYSVAGTRTPTWNAVRMGLIQESLDTDVVTVSVSDDGGRTQRELILDFTGISLDQRQSQLMQELGIQPLRPEFPAIIGQLTEGDPAQRDGLRPGDKVLSVNGTDVSLWNDWVELVRKSPEKPLTVVVERKGEHIEVVLTPKALETKEGVIGRIGAAPQMVSLPPELEAYVQYGPLESLWKATVKTWDMSVLTLRMIGKMLMGEVSVKNLSGPITIATYAGYTASEGVSTFLSFLAIVSLSLGVLNLLPIPILDGGHLLLYSIEAVKGKALSEDAQLLMQQVGMVLLGGLMILAFYNDLQRLF